MKMLNYDDILSLEPRLKYAESLAVEHAGRDRDDVWYQQIKPGFKSLVGFMSKSPHPELHTTWAYSTVYSHLYEIYCTTPAVSTAHNGEALGEAAVQDRVSAPWSTPTDGMTMAASQYSEIGKIDPDPFWAKLNEDLLVDEGLMMPRPPRI